MKSGDSGVWNKLKIIFFVCIFLCFSVLTIFVPKKTVSEQEKRKLADFPDLNLDDVTTGRFMSEISAYLDDHFIYRDYIIEFSGHIKACFGFRNQEIQYFEKPSKRRNKPLKELTHSKDSTGNQIDRKSAATILADETLTGNGDTLEEGAYENIKSVIVFKKRAIQVFSGSKYTLQKFAKTLQKYKTTLQNIQRIYCMAIPVGSDFYLPSGFSKSNEYQAISYLYEKMDTAVRCVDAYNELKSRKHEYIQFNTDHHWTGRGAYYAYLAFCKSAGIEPVPMESLQRKVIRRFLGSLYYYTLSGDLKENIDSVEYFKIPNKTKAYYFKSDLSKQNPTGLYAEYARGGNAYGVFLGADFPLMRIVSDVKNGKRILQIKDSYGNAFAPFLPMHYEEVFVVDYRYFDGSIKELMEKYAINEIIFSHNIYVINSSFTTYRANLMLTGKKLRKEPSNSEDSKPK